MDSKGECPFGEDDDGQTFEFDVPECDFEIFSSYSELCEKTDKMFCVSDLMVIGVNMEENLHMYLTSCIGYGLPLFDMRYESFDKLRATFLNLYPDRSEMTDIECADWQESGKKAMAMRDVFEDIALTMKDSPYEALIELRTCHRRFGL
ncbi:MAG: hypothetical protein LUD29_03190 [Clostridia bacterium]|nr:hypothetical protein [Clostridia bacterium]